MVLLESSLQAQELGRREGRPNAFGLSGERAVEEQAVLGHVITWHRSENAVRQKVTTAHGGEFKADICHSFHLFYQNSVRTALL